MTYYVAFLLDVQSRRIQVIGCTPYPNEVFVIQLAIRFDSFAETNMQLFDYIETVSNQRRHSTLGQISPAAFEMTRSSDRTIRVEPTVATMPDDGR